MAEKTSNKLVPLISVGVIILLLALFRNAGHDDAAEMRSSENIVAPDGDSSADALRTLTAEIVAVREENKLLAEQIIGLSQKVDEPVIDDGSSGKLADLAAKVDSLLNSTPDFDMGTPPDGMDFDFDVSLPPADEWIEPSDELPIDEFESSSLPSVDTSGMSFGGFDGSEMLAGADQILSTDVGDEETEIFEPVYTVPRNSTLIGSTGMTALIGRVPINGSVEDPYPVKIIIGKDNLTANGLELPEISHMIFTGTATGDWALSCVRADLTSATFIFADGTIRSLSVGDEALSNTSNNANRLAWISDQRGIPCISGKRISNASSFFTRATIAQGIAAGAKAVANSETTNVVSAQGDTRSSVTGNAVKNAGFEAVAGGADAIVAWLKEREKQSFDVIYADTGSRVAVHIDVELPIDYNPNGRKLKHGYNKQARTSRYLD